MADLVGFRAWVLDQAEIEVDADLKTRLNAQGAGITLTTNVEVVDNQPGHIHFKTDHRLGPARSGLVGAFINRDVWITSKGSNKKGKEYKMATTNPGVLA